MSQWSGTKAKQVLKALQNKGWTIKRQTGSHKILEKSGWNNLIFNQLVKVGF